MTSETLKRNARILFFAGIGGALAPIVKGVTLETENYGLKGVRQIEFVESTGAQWFDTGYVLTESSGFYLDFICYNKIISLNWDNGKANGYGCVMGCEQTGGKGFWWYGTWATSPTGAFNFGGKGAQTIPAGIVPGQHLRTTFRNGLMEYDPTTGLSANRLSLDSFTSTGTLGLFADKNSNDGFKESSSVRLYGLKLYDGDTLARDYIPCVDQNGVACLYELVNGECLYVEQGCDALVTNGAAVKVGISVEVRDMFDETCLVELSRDVDTNSEWTVFAAYGLLNHGVDVDAWSSDGGFVKVGEFRAGESAIALSVDGIPQSAKQLRFCAVPKAIGTIANAGRWTSSIDCDEARSSGAGTGSPNIQGAQIVSVGRTHADVNLTCAWIGRGASCYDVFAIVSNETQVLTNRIAAAQTQVGEPIRMTIDGLMPSRSYALTLWVTNGVAEAAVYPEQGTLLFETVQEFRNRLSDVSGAALLEYLTFHSGAYVPTGMAINDHQIECRFYDDAFVQDKHVWGSQSDANYTHFTVWKESDLTITWYWGVNGGQGHAGTWSQGEHEVVFNRMGDHAVCVDGEALSPIGTPPAGTSTRGAELLIGKRGTVANFTGRIYSFKITDSEGTLVRDMVPCLMRGLSSQSVGLYDLVGGTFYGNQGLASTLFAGPVDKSASAPVVVSNAVLVLSQSTGFSAKVEARISLVEKAEFEAFQVYVVHGRQYGGDDFDGWANVRRIRTVKTEDDWIDVVGRGIESPESYIRFAVVPLDGVGVEDRSRTLWSDVIRASELNSVPEKKGLVIFLGCSALR